MKRITLSGYYGYGNIGDELLAEAFTEILKNPGTKICILSKNKNSLADEWVNRFNIPAIIIQLVRSDIFVAGGGSQFQDASGPLSFWYYWVLAVGAKILGNKLCIESQGFGPFKSRFYKRMCGFLGNIADSVSIRDKKSQRFWKKYAGKNASIIADPAIWLLTRNKYKKNARNLVIIPRVWQKNGKTVSCAEALAECIQRYSLPALILPVAPEDYEECCRIKELCPKNTTVLPVPHNADDLMKVLYTAKAVVSVRLHGCIAAACAAVPCLGITYDPKIKGCAAEYGFIAADCNELNTINILETACNYDILPHQRIKRKLREHIYG